MVTTRPLQRTALPVEPLAMLTWHYLMSLLTPNALIWDSEQEPCTTISMCPGWPSPFAHNLTMPCITFLVANTHTNKEYDRWKAQLSKQHDLSHHQNRLCLPRSMDIGSSEWLTLQNLEVLETAESRIAPKWLFPPRCSNKNRFTVQMLYWLFPSLQ